MDRVDGDGKGMLVLVRSKVMEGVPSVVVVRQSLVTFWLFFYSTRLPEVVDGLIVSCSVNIVGVSLLI